MLGHLETPISSGGLALLVGALVLALGFEFVNGFHDTANAVATVIYTKSLTPLKAVALSGVFNLLGVSIGGVAVAMTILKLLPPSLVASGHGLTMVLALLSAAIVWNLGTWYLGLPASSSHTLIGAIVGVGLASSFVSGGRFGSGVDWKHVVEAGVSLLISPAIGFGGAAVLLLLAKRFIRSPALHHPAGEGTPPTWIRALLISTCSGVSFAHGSNDGQKGIGLVMLILIGMLPADFALNPHAKDTADAASRIAHVLADAPEAADARDRLAVVESTFGSPIAATDRLKAREAVADADHALEALPAHRKRAVHADREVLLQATDYAPPWVLVLVATALGLGTTIGWKRIVKTIGEKIGKTHLSYAQGACAELVAMATIGLAGTAGLPVSTTHVLSSGVAGTMVAQKSGLQMGTVRNIALAWVLTVPASMLLAGLFFLGIHAITGR